jgi:hypothetical protein
VFPFAGLCVGHPADDPWISVRLPMRLTVHRDRYSDQHLAAEIADYDHRRGQVNPYRNQRDTEQFGKKDGYGWSDDKARQTSTTDRLSFVQYLRKTGHDF